ncbi:4-aminobutyrate--2-oxoglutarate transaminase [Pantoea sp. ICBG 1758]|jgi:4-aminobutyrate aminotransferase|uniref:4-aminobutyrate--2-oxoglutarate transaminase n=1 Tax=Pantoea TaxID=53335 RepID=UPI000CE54AB0|nr:MULTISPECIES: 4-aminobutyrate--2-oxoglutarate transaminase [Pantoea]MCL9648790.1 4-aminobutyrate--2-oxoglutarate transaminase [Pantoea eucrina]MDJ0023566.1 4-aminobutyrate--2-oxoglutarate transaminase [Pantoea eucrina]NIE71382.1 4-aminobutyrate--2-oxoglutarate transaminase [Pantoea sp. Acro-807]PPC61944.1 4-aminobutyrate--2-oxoglutarate transaminase [Pantoea sp. ICBG 1758]RAU33416.1 4-aminobutyrate--2-oxoglutarate transaminase [Pantoea sp. RIT 413]
MEGKNSQLQQRKDDALPRGTGNLCPWFVEQAENATLRDTEGNSWIDFAGGIAVLNTGHRHPRVVQAIKDQLEKFTHTAFQVTPYENYVALAERINDLVPIAGKVKTAFFSTGAEAVENAVKVARAATRRHGIITFGNAFHGRTFMTMAMTGKVAPYKRDFGPMPASVFHARYPNSVTGITTADALASLDDLFTQDIAPQDVAAIVLEPVQGEGGFHIAPPEFMTQLRALADRHGILLIADEVQSGFGRTGKIFAMEHYGVEPDLITMAKSLAGGMPLSAVSGRAEIMDAPGPGGLGGTYAGNPLSIAAAHAVLDVIAEEQLCERSVQLGAALTEFLQGVRATQPAITDIRALGSMVAVEFADAQSAQALQQQAMAQGLLLLTCGPQGNVIRFLYPLTIPDAQFRQALDILGGLLTPQR